MVPGLRPLAKSDLDDVVALARSVCEADHLDDIPSREQVASQFDIPGLDLTQYAWVVTGPRGGLDALVSAVPLPSADRLTIHIGCEVKPERRGAGLEERLFRFAEVQATRGAEGVPDGAVFHSGIKATQTERAELLVRLGYRAVRWFLVLERPLAELAEEAAQPPGFSDEVLSPLDLSDDAFLVLDESFRDHWNQARFTLEQFRHLLTSIATAPLQTLLARDPRGEPAGVCIAHVLAHKNAEKGTREGEVAVLGVRRPYRGRGLGAHLLLRSLAWLRRQGMEVATIGVDAESLTGAHRLYERVGFTERSRAVVYHKRVRPG